MVAFVVGANLTISLLCLYVAWRIWKLRPTINRVERVLTQTERRVYNVLSGAPAALKKGQQGTAMLRQRYRRLQIQTQQLQRILAIASIAATFLPRQKPRRQSDINRRSR
ncbi:MAG: hypothetical protein ACRC8A_14555 [Microcoleaceae cyanobacterium]